MNRLLVIIDPQNDFMNSPQHQGSLAIDEAYADMERLVRYIKKDMPEQILVTLDSHTVNHIAHKLWWTNKSGNHPAPLDRKSTRLNSSHVANSYAVFCLKKK